LRDEFRKAHLDYLKLFEAATYFDGPFLTDDGTRELGSFKILDMPDKAAVEQHEADEPFINGSTIRHYHSSLLGSGALYISQLPPKKGKHPVSCSGI
jgi:uncharacterized protein YciI